MPIDPGPTGDHGGSPHVPVPWLAPVQGAAPAAGLGADRPRSPDVDRSPAPRRLDGGLCDRQPGIRPPRTIASASASTASSSVAGQVPLRRRRRRHVSRAELTVTCRRRCAGREPSRACSSICARTRGAQRGRVPRSPRVRRGDGVARVGPRPPAVRSRGRLLRRPRALGCAAQAGRPLRAPTAKGVEPIQPFPHAVGRTAGLDLSRRLVGSGWPSSTPPRSRSWTAGSAACWTGWPRSAWPRTRSSSRSATTACCWGSTAGSASATRSCTTS